MISERSKNAGIKELKIFDNFRVDKTLPKHAGKESVDNDGRVIFNISNNNFVGGVNTSTNDEGVWLSTPSEGNSIESWGDTGIVLSAELVDKLNIFKRLAIAFTLKRRVEKEKQRKKKENLITIRDYFIKFAEEFDELTPLADIGNHYEKAILQAQKLGQKSLIEKLKDLLDVVRGEAHLIQMGIMQYITNEQVCDFYESVDEDKDLKLTWIENFVKIIPNDIVQFKSDIDKRGVFDNYVILHYDPDGNATSLTKEQIEVKKDPILFGVIKNSKRLYYIGDWVDDYCDLTLEDMFAQLGEKTLEINNRNLKTYINKSGDYEQRRKKIK